MEPRFLRDRRRARARPGLPRGEAAVLLAAGLAAGSLPLLDAPGYELGELRRAPRRRARAAPGARLPSGASASVPIHRRRGGVRRRRARPLRAARAALRGRRRPSGPRALQRVHAPPLHSSRSSPSPPPSSPPPLAVVVALVARGRALRAALLYAAALAGSLAWTLRGRVPRPGGVPVRPAPRRLARAALRRGAPGGRARPPLPRRGRGVGRRARRARRGRRPRASRGAARSGAAPLAALAVAGGAALAAARCARRARALRRRATAIARALGGRREGRAARSSSPPRSPPPPRTRSSPSASSTPPTSRARSGSPRRRTSPCTSTAAPRRSGGSSARPRPSSRSRGSGRCTSSTRRSPHPVLRHELVHAVAGAHRRGAARASPRARACSSRAGLVEGLAVALEVPRGDWTVHEWSRAARDLGFLPDVAAIVGPAGFWAQAPARAYTAAGSFLAFLLERHGAATVARGLPRRRRRGRGRRARSTRSSPSGSVPRRGRACRRGSRPPRARGSRGGACSRGAARARRRRSRLAARPPLPRPGAPPRRAALWRRCGAFGEAPPPRRRRATRCARGGDLDARGRRLRGRARARRAGGRRAPRPRSRRRRATSPGAAATSPRRSAAGREALAAHPDRAEARLLEAKRAAAADARSARRRARYLLGEGDPALALARVARVERPLAAYLVGRALLARGEARAALPELARADAGRLPPVLALEARSLRAEARCLAGEEDAGAAALAALVAAAGGEAERARAEAGCGAAGSRRRSLGRRRAGRRGAPRAVTDPARGCAPPRRRSSARPARDGTPARGGARRDSLALQAVAEPVDRGLRVLHPVLEQPPAHLQPPRARTPR